jgi:hypothetical protein
MTMSNRELIRKADITVGDLAADGGLLNPEQANVFVRKLLQRPTLLKQIRVVMMKSPQMNINKVQFADPILKPSPGACTALAPVDRSKPTTEQVQLNSTEYVAEVRIPYDVLEDNIEGGNIGLRRDNDVIESGGGFKDTVMTLMAERVGLDLENLAINGDTASGNPLLATKDGFLKQANANIVDNLSAGVDKSLFARGLKTMPDQYLTQLAEMRHWTSFDQEITYRDSLGNRETTLGDAQIQGVAPVFGMGVPVDRVSLMPNQQGLFTHPVNLIFGIHRNIHLETDKLIAERCILLVVTVRVDFLIEEVEAVVKYDNIGPT